MSLNSFANDQAFITAFNTFKAEAEKATGTSDKRPRFGGFVIIFIIKELVAKALDLFKDGDFAEASAKVEEAHKDLIRAERSYCAHTLLESVVEAIDEIVGGLDDDLKAGLKKKYDAFKVLAEACGKSHVAVDMDGASRAFWSVADAIDAAPKEQAVRDRKRAEKVAEEARRLRDAQLAEKRAKKDRERDEQRRMNAEWAAANPLEASKKVAEREAKATELADQLKSLFGEVAA